MYLSSGDQATILPLPAGNSNCLIVCLDATSQTRADPSDEAEASSLPLGDQETLSAQKECPLSLYNSLGGGV